MFELSLKKQDLLTPLLTVAGAVDKKQSLAILSNILLQFQKDHIVLTATDLEIEMSARIPCVSHQSEGAVTIPAKKLVDIIRSLDDKAEPHLKLEKEVVTIKEGRSHFRLTTLPADGFPNTEDEPSLLELNILRTDLVHLLQSTQFAMSQQDVRVYLNGMLFEVAPQQITVVATDGHRMAINRLSCDTNHQDHKLLLPRKGVLELLRLLTSIDDERVMLSAGKNHIQIQTDKFTFVSKFFPLYFD